MKNNLFESSDMGLVVTLCALGFTINCVDKTNPRRVNFVLLREDGIDEAIQGYWSHSLAIDPLVLFSAQREVKTRLYQ